MYISMMNTHKRKLSLMELCDVNADGRIQIDQYGAVTATGIYRTAIFDGIIGWDQLGPQMQRYVYSYLTNVGSRNMGYSDLLFRSYKTNQPPTLTYDTYHIFPFAKGLLSSVYDYALQDPEIYNRILPYNLQYLKDLKADNDQRIGIMASIVYLNTFKLTSEQRMNGLLSYYNLRQHLDDTLVPSLVREMDAVMEQQLTQSTDVEPQQKALFKEYGVNVDHIAVKLPTITLTRNDLKSLSAIKGVAS